MRYNDNVGSVELSVRELCARACRRGDLGTFSLSVFDTGYLPTSHALAGAGGIDDFGAADGPARHGSAIHRKIQAAGGAFYHPEMALSNTFFYHGLYYTVSGRADGVIRAGGKITVDEIKTVSSRAFASEPPEIYRVQLKIYGYFLMAAEEVSALTARLCVVNRETEELKIYTYVYRYEELRDYYEKLIARIAPFAEILYDRVTEILPRASVCKFPYPTLRAPQELMIRETYSAIRRGKKLFVCAPTGTGKTVSALYPAVRALGKGTIDKIFYLTAKNATRREAFKAAEKLYRAGADLRTVWLVSKEEACANTEKLFTSGSHFCTADRCVLAKGYFNRVEPALIELLTTHKGYTPALIRDVALRYKVCPYELSLDLSEYCDVLLCDYNYAFDPAVRLRRYFTGDDRGENYAFLVDEAHNLTERARDMYSAELLLSRFEQLTEVLTPDDGRLLSAVSSLGILFSQMRRLMSDNLQKKDDGTEYGFFSDRRLPSALPPLLTELSESLTDHLRRFPLDERAPIMDALASSVRRFLLISEYMDGHFVFYIEAFGTDTRLRIYCVDPSGVMKNLLNAAKSTVFFSATLTPMPYFTHVLGCVKDAVTVSLPSPFDPKNFLVIEAPYLSVRLEDRKENARAYATVLAAVLSAKAGNYIAYFPSYEMLTSVANAFAKKHPSVPTVVQERRMGVKEKEEFLAAFREDGKTRIGFCVLGGSFAEGVDLPGKALIGTVVFGTGVPPLSNERAMIKEHFDEVDDCGTDYAYTFPGHNHVLQAAGRVIRTETDKGVCVLVDDRYLTPPYPALYPSHWDSPRVAESPQEIAALVKEFWGN